MNDKFHVKPLLIVFLVMAAIGLNGCGSTKVYTADKTIVYNDNLYNMANVQQVSGRIEGKLPDGSIVDMKTLDKKGVEALLKDNSQIMVSTVVGMDDRTMVYQSAEVKSYTGYRRMVDSFDDAMSDINKFMADKKRTQLKLN